MNSKLTVSDINNLVQEKIEIYSLMELDSSFNPKELSAHYVMKKAEHKGNNKTLNHIEQAYQILKDEEQTHIYNHYWKKQHKAESSQRLNKFKQSTKKRFNKLVLAPTLWALRFFWLWVWLYILLLTIIPFESIKAISGGKSTSYLIALNIQDAFNDYESQKYELMFKAFLIFGIFCFIMSFITNKTTSFLQLKLFDRDEANE